MAFSSPAQRRAAFARMNGGLGGKLKTIAGLALVGGILGGKAYLLHKYLAWRKGHQVTESPGFRNRRSFGTLPRRQQSAIIYAKRAQLRDLESIRNRGYSPRARQTRRWRFGSN